MAVTEKRIADLEERLELVEGNFPINSVIDTQERHVHLTNRFRRVSAVSNLPATLNQPGLFYIDTDPLALYIVDSDGRHELGFSVAASATSDLTLTSSFQDIPGPHATDGTAVDLPVPGTYIIVGNALFKRRGADLGRLLEMRLVIGGTAEAETARWVSAVVDDVPVTQTWRITTTSNDVIAKLQARKSSGTGASTAAATHTTIVAATFLGGASSEVTHQHAHSTLTGVGINDHHNEAHDVNLHTDTAGTHKSVTFYDFTGAGDQFIVSEPVG